MRRLVVMKMSRKLLAFRMAYLRQWMASWDGESYSSVVWSGGCVVALEWKQPIPILRGMILRGGEV